MAAEYIYIYVYIYGDLCLIDGKMSMEAFGYSRFSSSVVKLIISVEDSSALLYIP